MKLNLKELHKKAIGISTRQIFTDAMLKARTETTAIERVARVLTLQRAYDSAQLTIRFLNR